MRNRLKWMGIGLGGLAALVGLALAIVYVDAEGRLSKTYDIQAEVIPVPTDAAAVERGRRLVTFVRCTECHGADLAGEIYLEAPVIGRLVATNLTAGKGGIGGEFRDADWVRALRHGVGPDDQSLIITPAQYYYYLSDADAGAIIAYLKTVPPVDNELPVSMLGPLGRVFLLIEGDWLPAESIDHTGPRPTAPAPGVTIEYGEYLWRTGVCAFCHDQQFRPLMAGWSEADFITAMRTGRTPGGGQLDNESMPWRNNRQMTDDELKALWLYLQFLLAAEREGSRP